MSAADELAGLYREAIRRHAAEPVGYRAPIEATHRHELDNPQCGDRIELRLRVRNGAIEAAAFDGQACAVCLASASLLCSLAPGLGVAELGRVHAQLLIALQPPAGANLVRENDLDRNQPGTPTDDVHSHGGLPEELAPLLGVRRYPSRVQCAVLPWTAAERALRASPDAT